jgi:hypothetical protein
LNIQTAATVVIQNVKAGQARLISEPEQLSKEYRFQQAFDLDNFIQKSYRVSIPATPRPFSATIFSQQARVCRCPSPDYEQVLRYIKTIFNRLGLNTECSIICLIYIERLKEQNSVCLTNRNWRPILLAVLLVASKVWDDISIWNVEFAELFPVFSLQDINLLEKRVLEALNYNLYISSTQYAKYYFALRTMRLRQKVSMQPQRLLSHLNTAPKYFVNQFKPIPGADPKVNRVMTAVEAEINQPLSL